MPVVVERSDVEAALEARNELGAGYEPQIVDSLVERIERRLDERLEERKLPAAHPRRELDVRLALGSLGIGVAVTAIAPQGWVALAAWIAIVLVNLAYVARR